MLVKTPTGRIFWWNRRFLRRRVPIMLAAAPAASPSTIIPQPWPNPVWADHEEESVPFPRSSLLYPSHTWSK